MPWKDYGGWRTRPEGCRGRPLGGDVLGLAGEIRPRMEPKDRKEFAELRIGELKTARAC
jgi:hypothetical protein